MPKFVVDELRGHLDCGVLARGCAHFKCEGCGADRVTGLSCKGRGFCPRCCARRMTEVARHLTEKVFPHERVRQWVLSFPFALRWPLAFRHELMLAVSRILSEEIQRRYRRLARAAGLREPRGGSVAEIQRFGGGARLNPHFHTAHLDGAYGIDASGEERFFTAPAPSAGEVEEILTRVVARVSALMERCGGEVDLDDDEGSLAQAYAAASTARGTEKHAPDDAQDDELAGQVTLPTRRRLAWTASTWMRRWRSGRTTASGSSDSSGTSCGRRSRSSS